MYSACICVYMHIYYVAIQQVYSTVIAIVWVFGTTRPGIEPQSPGPLANTLLIRPTIIKTSDKQGKVFSCVNFWDEAWWFLSLRVFGLLLSSLLLFPQCFGRYVLWPNSYVCWIWEPTWNFELCPLLNPRGSPVLIPLAITGYKCKVFLYFYSPAVRIGPSASRWLSP